ncbi:unnamed protein product [Prorocentrum cordatum]|uniref:Uncharacterized protein n=1 Tax=Prorocentrum cordatum TaxID=2364126 RepID=A0ABN9WX68_9DINO|nr:unnamed protein product [Polarella glacialis]
MPLTALRAGRLSFLEAAALARATAKHFAARARGLVSWCQRGGASWSAAQEPDVILTASLAHLASGGFDAATDRVTAEAVRRQLPARGPPRAASLEGGEKLQPPWMRLPTPRPAVVAIVGVMFSLGQISFALSGALDHFARRPRWDSTCARDFEVAQARGAFDRAAERLGLEAQPPRHVLRHSAASDDRLATGRALSEVKVRGRRITDCSMRSCAGMTVLHRQMTSLSVGALGFRQRMDARLASVVVENAALQKCFPLKMTAKKTPSSRGRLRPFRTARRATI